MKNDDKMEHNDKMNQDKMGNNYSNFMLMLGLSFTAMYITMYLNTYELDHV